MATALRPALIIVLAAVALAAAFAPRSPRRVLDPNDPIAADGSMIAGRAATIYNTNAAYGAFRQPLPGSDDPQDVEADIPHARRLAEIDRAPIKKLLGPLDWSRCKNRAHIVLVSAVQDYYGARGRETSRFAARGPHAKAAIEQVWSTPEDRQIDDYVRHAVQYGILHKSEMPQNTYPEFARMFGDVQELGDGCPTAASR